MAIHRDSDLRPASHSWPKNTPYKKARSQVSDSGSPSAGPSTSGSNADSKSTAPQPISPAETSVERNPLAVPTNPTSSHAIQSKVKKLITQPEAFNSRSTISGPSLAFLSGAPEPTMQHSLLSAKQSSGCSASARPSTTSINPASKSILRRSDTQGIDKGMDKGKGMDHRKPSTPKKATNELLQVKPRENS